ncbi:MAG: amino acid permease [Bacteroidales bacterium]|nr:amino acid permease [Bacteroidales bacterium]
MQNNAGRLNTFGGVFTPSILTILGVIMYLRFGWVVGNVGLVGTLAIVTISTLITFLTALSIAAIATNAPVKTGGAYYMISRSLGIEIGGAVGIPLYLAQAFSVALYIIGFSESLVNIFPSFNMKLVGIITTLLLGTLSLFSTKAAIRLQFIILGVIVLSLLSLFFGSPLTEVQTGIWNINTEDSTNFWKVFAVFFPAVTGIMAGVNMSGDLKDPSKSIPKGTFWAIGIGFIIYMTIPVLLALWVDSSNLINDPLIMYKIAFWGGAILLGVWGATLSSAVGSLLGAPRVLQALTKDHVLPRQLSFLSISSGDEQIPRAATIFTILLTLILVYLGNLNTIAPILTMFFLTTYGILNVTAGIEQLLESPSFRPKFKVHWAFSFIGTIGCIAVMFLINGIATIISIFFISIVYIWLRRRHLKTTWGDVRSGMLLQIARYALLRLDQTNDPKSWRPNILVLSGMPTKRWHLIDFAYGLVQEKGLITVATILPESKVTQEKIIDYEKNISDYLNDKDIRTLVRVTRSDNPFTGAIQLVNSYGLGSLVPNTILLGDTEENAHHDAYTQMIGHFYKSKRNVIVLQNNFILDHHKNKQIDLWWGGLKGNGGLMMILSHLVKSSPHWLHIDVCIKMVVPTEEAAKGARKNLTNILASMRIGFRTQVIVSNKKIFWDILNEESAKSDMVMLGLKAPDEDFSKYYKQLKENTRSIKNKIFVLASQDIEFKDILN